MERENSLDKLLALASYPLGAKLERLPDKLATLAGTLALDLERLLGGKNGFFAFESALHVFPAGLVAAGYSLSQWNNAEFWRSYYQEVVKGCLFFAEDLFGEQFCIRDERIWRFNPETAEHLEVAASIEEWAERILANFDLETGYSLAHLWQAEHGALATRDRLVPKIPFIFGGQFETANLQAVDAVKSMRQRATIARQIKHLPDGTPVALKIAGAEPQ